MLNLPPELQASLLGRRVVFVQGRLDESVANTTVAQLLLIAQMAAGPPIELYLDSPGGSLAASLTVYDMIQTLSSPVSITCLGTAGGACVLVLAGGAAERRFALPHARIHLTEEAFEGGLALGRPDDLGRKANEAARLRTRWRDALARHAAASPARIDRDLASGVWLSAAEARDYGLVDGIIPGAPALGGLPPR
jgi:ATP-dependent Clp protease protease subunit